MIERIFLSGGGDKNASKTIDSFFIKEIQKKRLEKIIYIPIALTSRPYSECLQWFSSIFYKSVPNIEMWVNIQDKKLHGLENDVAIYIGGGNTTRLLKLIRKTGFDNEIYDFVSNGGILYGGSAGAIILGKDIRTAPESKMSKITTGLNLIKDISIACHFENRASNNLIILSKKLDNKILAIEENAGLVINNKNIVAIGPGKTYVFSNQNKEILNNYIKLNGY